MRPRDITKVLNGLVYFKKEIEAKISARTPLFLSTPSVYHIITGHRCNTDCIICFQDRDKNPELTGERVDSLFSEAKELSGGNCHVTLCGGEIMIYKPFYHLLERAQKLSIDCTFFTNGFTLTPENVKRILSFDPFGIGISIDSLVPEINDEIRAYKDATKIILEGFWNVINEKKRVNARCGILIKPTITGLNFHTIPDLVRYFGKVDGVVVHPQPYDWQPGQSKDLWISDIAGLGNMLEELVALKKTGYAITMNDEMITNLVRHFNREAESCKFNGGTTIDLQGKSRGCMIANTTLFITREGNAQFCYDYPPIGNVMKNSLKEIWYSKEAFDQRERIKHCNIDCWQACMRPSSLVTKAMTYLRLG